MTKYGRERAFLVREMQEAYRRYAEGDLGEVRQKSRFDLVTDIDCNIEGALSAAILAAFPGDHIHGEETSGQQPIEGRTWTIDPIDGTCNMAIGVKLYGVQCALFDGGEVVLSVIYLPHFSELIWAEKGEGCWLNDRRVFVKRNAPIEQAVVSFGDYPHAKTPRVADRQHAAVRYLYSRIAKIRMFGAACIDFYGVAAGKTDATVVITKNLWDIAPGILMCREAGALLCNLRGEPYAFGDAGVVACAGEEIAALIRRAFNGEYRLPGQDKRYKLCIFDFDGVILNSEPCHYRAWNEAFRTVGAGMSEEEYHPLKSTGRTNILRYLEQKLGRALTGAEREKIVAVKDSAYRRESAVLLRRDLIGGVTAFLQLLARRGVSAAIASSGAHTLETAERFGVLDLFDFVADGSVPMPKKPAPDLFLYVSRLLGVPPEACLVFEDAPAGLAAARAAGMDVVAVGGAQSQDALLSVASFCDLLQDPAD